MPRRELQTRAHRRSEIKAWGAGGGFYPVLDPPPTPAGWTTGPPDFVGVGTARCGSTWWFANLRAHPDVSRAPRSVKETSYFDRFEGAPIRAADVEQYHRFFPRRPGTLAGEWTPRYMFDQQAVRSLRQAGARKVLVLVRDPVERIWSHMHADRSWSAAPWRRSAPPDMMLRGGLFLAGLENIAGVFEPSDVLVLQYERCVADTAGQLRRTYEFVGLDPDFRPPNLALLRAEPASGPTPPMPDETRAVMTEFYRPHVKRLIAACPAIDVSLWPNFSDAI